MNTTKKIDLLKSFEKSFDSSKCYKISKTDGTISIGKVVDFDKAEPGELFNDPETGNIYDSAEIIVNIYIETKSNSNPEKINFRTIQNIELYINS